MVCVRGGEGGPLYSANRSVPALNKFGNIVQRLGVDQDDLPAKVEVGWRQIGAGRPCGSAGPRVPPLAPPFVLDTARWAPILDVLCLFSPYSAYGCLQTKNHQNSWKWLAISSITIFGVAGVDSFISDLRTVNSCRHCLNIQIM